MVFPSLCIDSPASQTGLPAGSVLETFVLRGSRGDKCLALINRFYRIVDAFRVVALIREKGTSLQREDLVGCGEDVNGDCGIHDVGLGGQLVEWQAGDAVHQHMALVPPVELIPPLIVLVGG